MKGAEEKENLRISVSPQWFFAEWLSILATFLICFVFLFYQNQTQAARTDKLYEMFIDLLKEGKK